MEELVSEEFLDVLVMDYTPAEIPPCPVCGSQLTIADTGGQFTKYACPNTGLVGGSGSYKDRREHYTRSERYQRQPGDHRVLRMIAELRRLRAELEKQQKKAS